MEKQMTDFTLAELQHLEEQTGYHRDDDLYYTVLERFKSFCQLQGFPEDEIKVLETHFDNLLNVDCWLSEVRRRLEQPTVQAA
jgi:hypothetical protein